MVLTVHHLQVSQSERVVWLCEELGIEYDLKLYKRHPVFSPPEYLALHPIGAAPVIEDGKVKLAESEAVVEYILNIYGPKHLAIKPGSDNYADYLYWYHFANGSLQPGVSKVMSLRFAGIADDNAQAKRYSDKLHQYLSYLNDRLSTVPYLAGKEFTAAEVMTVFTLTTMRQFASYDLSKYTHILEWLKRVTSREGYRKAMNKGDPEIEIESQIQGQSPAPFPAIAGRK